MATNRPQTDQGRGIRRLYVIFDAAILGLTVLLILSLARMPARFRELRCLASLDRSTRALRGSWLVLSHLTWPLLLLYLVLNVVNWRVVLFLYELDLGYWLSGVAIVVFLKGLLELTLL